MAMFITLFFLFLVYVGFWAANAALSSIVPNVGRRRNWLAVQGIRGEGTPHPGAIGHLVNNAPLADTPYARNREAQA